MNTTRHPGFIIHIIILLFCVSIFSCSDDDEDILMWIASEKTMGFDPVSTNEYPMLRYKLRESDSWMLLGESIAGFDYEEGYEYIILVKMEKIKNSVPDLSGEQYTLIEIISKTKKESPPSLLL